MQIIILSNSQTNYRVNVEHIVSYHQHTGEQTFVQTSIRTLHVDQSAEEIDKLLGVDPCDTQELVRMLNQHIQLG